MSAKKRQTVDTEKRTLAPMDWASDLDFLGAIATVLWLVGRRKVDYGSVGDVLVVGWKGRSQKQSRKWEIFWVWKFPLWSFAKFSLAEKWVRVQLPNPKGPTFPRRTQPAA
jgi:hypothetical protein